MGSNEIVQKILNAHKWSDLGEPKASKSLKSLQKTIHPDVCSDPRSSDAFIKLSELFYKEDIDLRLSKGFFENGTIKWVFNRGDYDLRDKAMKIQGKIYSATKEVKWAAEPEIVDNNLISKYGSGWWPLESFEKFDKETVAWIWRRLLAVINVASNEGFVHGDLNDKTIFIHPEEHGLRLDSWWSGVSVGDELEIRPTADTPPGFLSGNPVDSSLSVAQGASLMLRNNVSPGLEKLLKEWRLRPIQSDQAFRISDDAIKKDFGKRVWHPLEKPKIQSV